MLRPAYVLIRDEVRCMRVTASGRAACVCVYVLGCALLVTAPCVPGCLGWDEE